MKEIISISLENEMDLVLAHRRSMKVAEKLGLTIATQTTFATAVSEIARMVIEHTDNGRLILGLLQNKQRYNLRAYFQFEADDALNYSDSGYQYARKLLPEFNIQTNDGLTTIEMMLGLPRSLKLDEVKIKALKEFFVKEEPLNAYEEIKRRNISLSRIAEEQGEEIRQSKIIDEKKTEFISIASHEIKTPITVIKAYAQIARKVVDDAVFLRGIVEKIDFQSTKLLSLVQQLLDVSKIENGNLVYSMELVSLNSFVGDMASIMEHILPNHQIITELGEDVTVNIDKIRMEQVFSNVLGNAAKYSDNNTTIKITSRLIGDDFAEICITDQGIGMSQNGMKSIFEKFYRNEDVLKSHTGLGMGLYVTSKIVTDHGGKIWVTSEEGVGSKFYFTIPVS